MNNYNTCQRIYDNMEHPDYYDNISHDNQEAHKEGYCSSDCILCVLEQDLKKEFKII